MKKILSFVLAAIVMFGFIAGIGMPVKADEFDGEILIGCLQDITGPTSTLGLSVQMGAAKAVEEINAAGGIDGKEVVMKTYDTKGDVTEAVNAYINAVSVDEVAFIVGPPVANIAHAIKETSEDYDVPVLGFALDPAVQIKEDGTPYKNMFCFQPSATDMGRIMAQFAVKNGYETFGIIYNQENSYSLSLLDPFINQLEEDGITIEDNLIIPYGAADTDFKTLLQPLVSADVDAIYAPNYTQQLVTIVTAATELGYEGKIVAGLDAAPSFNTIYGQDASNVYYINNIDIFDEETAELIAEVEDDVSAVNKYFLGHDVINIAKMVIEDVGLEDPDAFREALENVTDYEGYTGKLSIDPETHMPKDMAMYMYTYDDQTPVLLEEYAGE